MKILFLLPSLKRTGPINVALNLCHGLKENDKDIKVYILALKNGDLYNEFKNVSKNIEILNIKYIFSIFKYIKNNNFDIIHSHCLIPDLISSMIFFNITKICTLHNYINADYINQYGKLKGGLVSYIHKLALKKIPNIISCSESVASHILLKYNIISHPIPNGINNSQYYGEISNNTTNFIIACAFIKRKNIELSLDAFILANLPIYKVTIIGSGPLFKTIKNKYKHISNFNFLGHVSNPRDYFNKSDIFISSSLAEGLPISMLEAIAEANTYIVSNIGPHIEINDKMPTSGFIVNNDTKSFSDAITKIQESNIIKMKENSKKLFNENYTSSIMSNNYYIIYKSII